MLGLIGEWLLNAAAFLVVLYLLVTVVYSLHRLAQRRRRRHDRQHRSRFPYVWILLVSSIVWVGAFFPTVFMIRETEEGPPDILLILFFLSLLVVGWSLRGFVRQKMPSAAAAIEQDPRPAVLYLRSFDQENLLFVMRKDQAKFNDPYIDADDIQMSDGSHDYRDVYHGIHTWPGMFVWNFPLIQSITFEKYFRREVIRCIGPFIALGNPIDSLPVEGAFRDYQVDERWKDIFYERSAQCACILMQLGSSNNLQFEMMSIVRRGMRHKLFILTQPQAYLFDLMAPARKYILREKPADWRTFSGILRANGYQVPHEDPGVGAILTFEPDGQPLILKQGAFEPEEYIGPIQERLQQLKLVPVDKTPAEPGDATRE